MVPSQNTPDLQVALQLKEKLTQIINAIHQAQDISEIIVNTRLKILEIFGVERITIFAVDARNQQVYSLFKEGEELKEIRVANNTSSMVGFAAVTGQKLNIRNAYDAQELAQYHPELKFDSSWDKKTGFTTRQVLTVPIMFEKYLMGVLQLLNKTGEDVFSEEDVAAAMEVAKTLGIAFYNRRRLAPQRSPNEFSQLINKGLISEKSFEDAVSFSRMNNRLLAEVLTDKYRISKNEVLESLAAFYNTGYFFYDGTQRIPEELCDRLKQDYLKKMGVAPLELKGSVIRVAMADPSDLAKVDAVRVMDLAPREEVLVALPNDIMEYIHRSYNPDADIPEGDVSDILGELATDEEEGEEELEQVEENDSAVVRLSGQLILDGFKRGASDIHVEPYGAKRSTQIRFRVDGVCHLYQNVPATHRAALVSRLKIMSNLDISERRLPQDGKIRFRTRDRTIELRVATIPTTGGEEDVVMRILAASKPIPLDDMGFSERNLAVFKEIVSKPYGIILCVGPTGSGKTTTLHSGLGHINEPERKIWTAEDPVEITQAGLRQVQVKPKIGFTFASAMRAFLRADPDVIMVGELRDQETAEIAVSASLTGHLVLSTLHTNSAPETVTRLLEMDIEAFNFADSLLGILAQRLVRRVCTKCREAYNPSEEEFRDMVEYYGPEAFDNTGIKYNPGLKLYQAPGCPECAGTGYKGRVALHELLIGTDEIKRLIQKSAPVEEIRVQAMADGMSTLMQDGIMKVFAGQTDFTQVRTVCVK